jgi:hypothetical protein
VPTENVASVPFTLTRAGAWVLLEEVWKEGLWVDNNRGLMVPDGANVSFRHNFIWPPWHWEVGLGGGTHFFHIADGWNKFQVRLNSPSSGVVVVSWIL